VGKARDSRAGLFLPLGGCFIIAAAIAVQILDLHGYILAIELVAIATIAAWLLLPKRPDASAEDGSEIESTRRPK